MSNENREVLVYVMSKLIALSNSTVAKLQKNLMKSKSKRRMLLQHRIHLIYFEDFKLLDHPESTHFLSKYKPEQRRGRKNNSDWISCRMPENSAIICFCRQDKSQQARCHQNSLTIPLRKHQMDEEFCQNFSEKRICR